MSNQETLQELREALVGDASYEEVTDLTKRLMAEVGERFEAFEIFLPDLMIAGEKMKQCMKLLQPHIQVAGQQKGGGHVVLGTVSGDLHDIGKNLVATMLTVGGFEVTDLGVNVAPLDFVKAAREQRADIIALSSLMTASLPYQREVLDLLTEMGHRDRYYVIVGGGPVTPDFAGAIGADGWAENAAKAVGLCKTLLGSAQTPPVDTVIA
jgi:methylmalonyl-CoA mutase cobalamin-binding domain/chain